MAVITAAMISHSLIYLYIFVCKCMYVRTIYEVGGRGKGLNVPLLVILISVSVNMYKLLLYSVFFIYLSGITPHSTV